MAVNQSVLVACVLEQPADRQSDTSASCPPPRNPVTTPLLPPPSVPPSPGGAFLSGRKVTGTSREFGGGRGGGVFNYQLDVLQNIEMWRFFD